MHLNNFERADPYYSKACTHSNETCALANMTVPTILWGPNSIGALHLSIDLPV